MHYRARLMKINPKMVTSPGFNPLFVVITNWAGSSLYDQMTYRNDARETIFLHQMRISYASRP